MQRRKVSELTQLTMFLAMGVVLNYFDPSFSVGVPGAKLGLANIIGIIVLYLFGVREMISLNFMRVLIVSIIKGLIFSTAFWLSLSGTMLSTLVVIICRKLFKPSIVMLSVISALTHSLGQVIAVSFIYSRIEMFATLPYLWLFSIPTGIVTGILAQEVLKRVSPKGGY